MSNGSYTQLENLSLKKLNIDDLKATFSFVDAKLHYNHMMNIGLAYGEEFQTIRNIWKGDKEALLYIAIDQAKGVVDGYNLHPTLLDACFQGVATAINEQEDNQMFLPLSIGEFTLYKKSNPLELWCYIQVTSVTSEEITSDMVLADVHGEVIGTIAGFVLKKVPTLTDNVPYDRDFYQLIWEQSELLPETTDTTNFSCLIFADEYGIGERLASSVSSSILVYPGQEYAKLTETKYMINPRKKEDLSKLFKEIVNNFSSNQLTKIVYGWGFNIAKDLQVSGETYYTLTDIYTNLLHLVQEVSTTYKSAPPMLWIMSNRVHHILDEKDVSIFQAPLWGFGRTMAIANPELFGGLVDIDADHDIDKLVKGFLSELKHGQTGQQIAYRYGKKFIAKLEKYAKPKNPKTNVEISPNHAYLITGGLGFLGLTFAHWLANNGARQIILMSRTGLPDKKQRYGIKDTNLLTKIQSIRDLENKNVDVRIITVDVSDKVEMNRFLTNYHSENIRDIKGVIHAAGVVYNQSIDEISRSDITKIMNPKVKGALHLHEHFQGNQLDFFVLFSSITSMIAPPRLSLYAAANAFLDALAHERNRLNLPAMSINWGPWAEQGMAADGYNSHTGGIDNLPVENGVSHFEHALQLNESQIAIAHIDWGKIGTLFPSVANSTFLKNLTKGNRNDDPNKKRFESSATLIDKNNDESNGDIKTLLKKEVSAILRLPVTDIHNNMPLNTLGLDSMMALELSNQIEVHTKLNIPMAQILKGISIDELADYIELEWNSSNLEEQKSVQVEEIRNGQMTANNVHKERVYPLSQGQRSLWFLQEMYPENTAYNVGFSVSALSGFDFQIFKETLNRIVARHESLRLKVINRNGEPFQYINPIPDFELHKEKLIDFSELEIKKKIHQDLHRPFLLSNDSIFRVYVYECNAQHILLFVIHHIAIDYWGIELLLKDFKDIYGNLYKNNAVRLPVLSNDYEAFVSWQTEFINSKKGKKQLDYWTNQLDIETQELELPFDAPHTKEMTFEGASIPFEIDARTVQKLKHLLKSEKVTIYVFLLSVYQLLLHRYSGQDELVVGSPASGRNKVDFKPVIGDFINMLPMISNINDNPKFTNYLKKNNQTVLAALENQDYPFPLLVENIRPNRNPARSPIFQTSFILQTMNQLKDLGELLYSQDNDTTHNFAGLSIKAFPINQQEGQLDLTMELTESNEKLMGLLKYNKQLFTKDSIERMTISYCTLIDNIIKEPELNVKKFGLLKRTEKIKLLIDNNKSINPSIDLNNNLFDLINQVAKKYPDRIALEFQGHTITYKQLIYETNKIASHLLSLNVQKGDRIGIHMERSLEMVISLLGVLRIGAAYVPMDPNFPKDRLDWMIEDSNMSYVLSNKDSSTLQIAKYKILYMDEILRGNERIEMSDLTINVSPNDSAYIIYTSGSTGRPKGVEVQHKAVINFLKSMEIKPGIDKDDCLLAITTLSFDISVLEIFLPLIKGAKSIILGSEDIMDGRRLKEKITKIQPTIIQATPATWRILIDVGWCGNGTLKALCGGEALTKELANEIGERCGELWNLYGPTEATVWVLIKEMKNEVGRVTIGKPIDNMEAYILDDHLNPTPKGVIGNLYIGGVGLAKGYVNRPDLNNEKFQNMILPDHSVRRVYDTGDTARILENGDIEFFGRTDNQVKINGYRIEFGEIESVLNLHESIKQAIVILDNDGNSKKLVAYIQMHNVSFEFSVEELREYLMKKVPHYMVPSMFIKVTEIPLTPNGKVDRKSLRLIEGKSFNISTNFVMAKTKMEKDMTKIWSNLLNKERIGINDNFFDIGGSSILATKLHVKLKEQLLMNISIIDIFHYPTIKLLSEVATGTVNLKKEDDRTEKVKSGKQRLSKLRDKRRLVRGR